MKTAAFDPTRTFDAADGGAATIATSDPRRAVLDMVFLSGRTAG